MKICRFRNPQGAIRVGWLADPSTVLDLTPAGIDQIHPLLESENPCAQLQQITRQELPCLPLSEVRLCAPVEEQEVWAAGVTYSRSKTARMGESAGTLAAGQWQADRPLSRAFAVTVLEATVARQTR
jgi:2-dehydro-3-deoxy-D-arabinonate dehydratase